MPNKNISTQREGNALLVTLYDVFDYEQGKKFQKECEKHVGIDKYIIDFRHVTVIESSSLGRLLLLRTRMGHEKADITLCNPNKLIAKIFRMSQFQKLFKIE
ncbi:MAG: STAS domain-containing protein [Magnetococcales bacterium]|nr:STAS domain-containing protein [Magnetococcales bacterium]